MFSDKMPQWNSTHLNRGAVLSPSVSTLIDDNGGAMFVCAGRKSQSENGTIELQELFYIKCLLHPG